MQSVLLGLMVSAGACVDNLAICQHSVTVTVRVNYNRMVSLEACTLHK